MIRGRKVTLSSTNFIGYAGVHPGAAATNGLAAMVGGDPTAAEEAMPALTSFAKAAIYFGPHGTGMAAKLVRNYITFGEWKVMYDAACFARAAGVDYRRVKEVIQTADPTGEALTGMMQIRGDSLDELSPAKQEELRKYWELTVKDLEAARELADANDFTLPMLEDLMSPAIYGIENGA